MTVDPSGLRTSATFRPDDDACVIAQTLVLLREEPGHTRRSGFGSVRSATSQRRVRTPKGL